MSSYCDCPAGLRLNDTGGGPSPTLDFMDEDGGIRVDSLDIGFPTIREAVVPHPTQDGNYDYTSLCGPRVVTITGTFIPSVTHTDRQTIMHQIALWCLPTIRPQLVYCIDSTSPTKVLVVRGSQFSAPVTNRLVSAFTVSFVAPDPAATSFLAKEITIEPGETAQATNEGTYTAWPTLTIHGPCVAPAVEWRGGGVIFGDLELGEDEHVDISPKVRSVSFMGRTDPGSSRYGALDFTRTRWQGFAPGVTELYATAPVTVTWHDTYI